MKPILTNWIDALPSPARDEVHAAMVRRHFKAGESVYRAGDASSVIYQIVSGTVQFTEVSESGQETLYAMSGSGTCFGMAPAIDGGARPSTATAVEDTVLDCLPQADFERLRNRHPSIDRALLVWAFGHLRELLDRYLSARRLNLRRRLASQILFLLDYAGPLPDGRPRQTVELTQERLAASIGATRQGISKILQEWSDAGVLQYHYGRFRVLEVERLRAEAPAGQD